MSASGSPRTATTSAILPVASVPRVSAATEQLGGNARRGLDRLHRRHAAAHHLAELAEVAAVRTDRRVGSHRDLDAGGDGGGDRLPVEAADRARPSRASAGGSPPLDLRALDDVPGGDERRHQVRALLLHQRDALLVEQAAVLDAGDTGDQRVADPGGGHRVRHNALADGGRLLHRDPDLVDRELRVVGEVARRSGHRRSCRA